MSDLENIDNSGSKARNLLGKINNRFTSSFTPEDRETLDLLLNNTKAALLASKKAKNKDTDEFMASRKEAMDILKQVKKITAHAESGGKKSKSTRDEMKSLISKSNEYIEDLSKDEGVSKLEKTERVKREKAGGADLNARGLVDALAASTGLGKVPTLISGIKNDLIPQIKSTVEYVRDVPSKISNFSKSAHESAIAIKDGITNLPKNIKETAAKAKNKIAEFKESVKRNKTLKGLILAVSMNTDLMRDTSKKYLKSSKKLIKATKNLTVMIFRSIFSRLMSFGKGLFKGMKSLGGKGLGALGRGAKGAGKLATKAGGGLLAGAKGLGKVALKGAKALPVVGQVLAAGMAGYDAFSGFKDAARISGKKEGDVTTADRFKAATSSVVSGLTFGLLDDTSVFKKIEEFGKLFTGKEGILTKIGDFISKIKNNSVVKSVTEAITGLVDFIKSIPTKIKEFMTGGISKVGDAGKAVFNKGKAFLSKAADNPLGAISSLFSSGDTTKASPKMAAASSPVTKGFKAVQRANKEKEARQAQVIAKVVSNKESKSPDTTKQIRTRNDSLELSFLNSLLAEN
jgi:hypothetical protein